MFGRTRSVLVATVACVGFAGLSALMTWSAAEEPAQHGVLRYNPAKVVGHDACAKCHTQEVLRWMLTPHHTTFDELHRTPAAKEIAARLNLNSIKRNDVCIQCHYTQQQQGQRVRVIAGISCESCHGAAADWLELHADYGGPGITRETEPPAHRQQRRVQSMALGMNNPGNLYQIARECYGCHTVPNEELVNAGGHQAGSTDFELVAWSQGSVRHNFVRSGGTMATPEAPERLRVMFVVGVMADLEYSLRAVAKATIKAAYAVSSAERAVVMKRRLREIVELVDHPRIDEALEAVATVELRLGNRDALLQAADRISTAAHAFAEEADGGQFAAVDPLLPTPRQYKN